MFHLARDGTILDFYAENPELLYGRPEKFLGRNVAEELPAEPAARICQTLLQAIDSRQAQSLEYRLELGGTIHDFQARILPCSHDQAVAIILDITDHSRAESAMRQSEERYRRLFATVSDAIVLIDASDQRFVDVNDAALAAYGYSREEFLQLTVADISAEPEVTREAAYRVGVGELVRIPFRLHRRRDGRIFPVEISASRFMQGDRALACGVIRDITERKRTEDQLRQLSIQLDLAEERERRRLAADLHDGLAQNLAMCLMRVDLLQERASTDIGNALQQVRELLEDSIRKAQTLTFELSPPALYDLGLPEAVRSLGERLLNAHGIRFSLHSSGSPELLGNDLRVLLFRATRELLINVIKHARATRVGVTMKTQEEQVEIVVEDDGIGLGLGGPTHGGGFGLFQVRERLGHIGGRAEVSAGAGSGTRVVLSAPIAGLTAE